MIMGILNRTPDSFYDRGETYELDVLLDKGREARRATAPTCSTSAASRPDPGPR